ncbi:MAG: DNA replication and repair protein RecF [Acidobacteriota bacterium]|nr:MAG: DNA replication and repair protein RecF [Acidobacteriota bacterium]
MHLRTIEAVNFRNLSGSVEFSPGLNVIYGDNAQGKSGWLEAIYLLATTKSFRTSHPKEAIRHGEVEAVLRGSVARGSLVKEIQLLIAGNTKQTFLNAKREPVARYLGAMDAIPFTAEDMQVVRGAPEARRKFLDRGIFGIQPAFLGTINEYNRVLKQKNALLREASEAEDPLRYLDLIAPWNDQLIALAIEIHAARTGYVERLKSRLAPGLFVNEAIEIRYKSSLEGRGDLDDYATLLRERLDLRLKNEIAIGYSLVGPHRDDLEILFDGFEIARYGSSGQQRSALLILDLAQLSVYHDVFEEYPIFLIDDLDAELDRIRIGILLEYLEGRAQTIVSTSKRSIADRYRDRAATFLVQAGQVVREGSSSNGASLEQKPQAIQPFDSLRSSEAQTPAGDDAAGDDPHDIPARHRAPF